MQFWAVWGTRISPFDHEHVCLMPRSTAAMLADNAQAAAERASLVQPAAAHQQAAVVLQAARGQLRGRSPTSSCQTSSHTHPAEHMVLGKLCHANILLDYKLELAGYDRA